MAWWFAPFYDGFMRSAEERSYGGWRAELLEALEGEVLDLGAGTGANVPFWPQAVTRIVATEPDVGMAGRLRVRAGEDARIKVVEAAAEALPFADASFDAVVCTLVLCTVGDLERSIAEALRVLRPGGRLAFMEHVAADESAWRRLGQRLAEPVWTPIAGGCRLTRRTHEALERGGFRLESCTRASARGAMAVVRETVRGVARRP